MENQRPLLFKAKWQPALAIKVSTWFKVLGCCCTATRSWLKRGWFASVAKGPAKDTDRVLQNQTAKTNQQLMALIWPHPVSGAGGTKGLHQLMQLWLDINEAPKK